MRLDRSRRRSPARHTLLGLVLLLAGCNMHRGNLQGRASDEWTRTYTLQDGGEFQVVGGVGTIDVEAGTGTAIEVKAERVVRAASNETAESMVSKVKIGEDVAPDKIVLRSEGLGGIIIGVEIEVNFHVTVPPSTRLRLHTAGGNISLANLSGIVVASSTNGNVSAKALGGGVDARSTNGNLDIDLAAVSKDAVDLRAVNGGIRLAVPASANANVEVNCTNGTIDIAELPLELTGEQSRRRARGRLNEGGTPVEATAVNGDIHIRARK
jgi:putative adhesin